MDVALRQHKEVRRRADTALHFIAMRRIIEIVDSEKGLERYVIKCFFPNLSIKSLKVVFPFATVTLSRNNTKSVATGQVYVALRLLSNYLKGIYN